MPSSRIFLVLSLTIGFLFSTAATSTAFHAQRAAESEAAGVSNMSAAPWATKLGAKSKTKKTKSKTKKTKSKTKKSCQILTLSERKRLKKLLRKKNRLHRGVLTNKQCQRRLVTLQRKRPSSPKPVPIAPPTVRPPVVFGLSANGEPALQEAESKLGLTAGVVGVFTDFTDPFPAQAALDAQKRGAALLISWEPWDWEVKTVEQPTYSLDRIKAGDFDPYIRQFAQDAAKTVRPVYVRFAAEMNGDWHVWSTGVNGNDNTDYAEAYRHVVNVARNAGGTNIKWMFNPIVSYEGSTPMSQLYPGDGYADWVALDGYNWGALKWGWQSFTDIFTRGLNELKLVAPNKPLAVAEIGSTPGPLKAEWVRDSLQKMNENGVRMVVWFEHNKETDWRLSSDPTVASMTNGTVKELGWVTGGDYAKVAAALRP